MLSLDDVMSRRNTPVIAKLSTGQVIRATPMTHAEDLTFQTWQKTGDSLHKAMKDFQNTMQ